MQSESIEISLFSPDAPLFKSLSMTGTRTVENPSLANTELATDTRAVFQLIVPADDKRAKSKSAVYEFTLHHMFGASHLKVKSTQFITEAAEFGRPLNVIDYTIVELFKTAYSFAINSAQLKQIKRGTGTPTSSGAANASPSKHDSKSEGKTDSKSIYKSGGTASCVDNYPRLDWGITAPINLNGLSPDQRRALALELITRIYERFARQADECAEASLTDKELRELIETEFVYHRMAGEGENKANPLVSLTQMQIEQRAAHDMKVTARSIEPIWYITRRIMHSIPTDTGTGDCGALISKASLHSGG